MKCSFKKFLDYIAFKDKNTGNIIYPNELTKKRMYSQYKILKRKYKVWQGTV